jgi:hypothetical protein
MVEPASIGLIHPTEDEYILARLQLEREQRMSGWNVPGPRRPRRTPPQARAKIEAAEQVWRAA